jgi:hypothetical protein
LLTNSDQEDGFMARFRKAFATAALLTLAGHGLAPVPNPPEVPAGLEPPAGQLLAFSLHAKGVQIYECRPTQADAARFEWALKAPQADLFDASGTKVARHYAGPTWEGLDGSKVVGEVKAKDTTRSAGSIPWLLLGAKTHSGEGLFAPVRSIQRLDTSGGAAPAEAADKTKAGLEIRVPYEANYAFYVTGP